MDSCLAVSQCFDITVTPFSCEDDDEDHCVTCESCDGGLVCATPGCGDCDTCKYLVCLKFDSTRSDCTKDDAISHICGGEDVCADTGYPPMETNDFAPGDIFCVTGGPRDVVTFVTKDGSGCEEEADKSLPDYDDWTCRKRATDEPVREIVMLSLVTSLLPTAI